MMMQLGISSMVPRCRGLHLLRHFASIIFQGIVVVLNRLEYLRVSVGCFDERGSFTLQDLFCPCSIRIDQCNNLQSRTKLVLESERMAAMSAEPAPGAL